MDGAIVFLVLVAILFLAGLPLVALGLAIAAGNRARRNEAQLQLMDENMQAFNAAIASINRTLSKAPESVSASVEQSVGTGSSVSETAPQTVSATASDVSAESLVVKLKDAVGVRAEISETSAYIVTDTTAERNGDTEAAQGESLEEMKDDTAPFEEMTSVTPDAADVGDSSADADAQCDDTPSTPPRSLEEQIGLVWFTRIGALIGILVAGWFFKYVVDNDIVGPWGRVAIGAFIGLALLMVGEVLFRNGRTNRIFNQGMQGLGLALLLISTYASSGFYHLVPVPTAFGATAILCLLGGALAIRHRSEGVLIFSLLAAFMNPVMLSTGTDRPLALFTYLFVLTVLTLVFCVKHNFRVTIWITVSGVVLLFAGWYGTYFDIRPDYIINDVKLKAGAYFSLTARIIPLCAAMLFPVAWAIAGIRLAAHGHRQTSLALFLGAGVAVTGAITALLYDHYLILACSLLGIGAAYSALLIRMRFGQLIGVPMITSFLTLLWISQKTEEADIVWMMILGGALLLLFIGMVIHELVSRRTTVPMPSLFVLCGSGVLFVVFAGAMLLPDRYMPFGIIIVAMSLLYLIFASYMNNKALRIVAVALSGVLLISRSDNNIAVDDGYIYVASAWFVVTILAISFELFVQKVKWSKSLFGLLTGVGAAFLVLILANTETDHNTLRSVLCIGAGITYLLIGTRLLRLKPTHNDLTTLPLGAALGFFGIATGLLLSGVSMTVAFAMEAISLAFLASRTRRNDNAGNLYWFIGALVFAVVAVVHMFGTDVRWLADQRHLFHQSLGSEGSVYAAPLLNPFALSRIAIALFLFLMAFFFRKIERYTPAVRAGIILGHGLVIWLLATEIQLLLTSTVSFTSGLTTDEFEVVWREMTASLSDESTQRGMIITSVMGIYALGLIGAGFAMREVLHRILGIALFGITLLKLGLWDIWKFDTIYRIAVGATMATALMAGGYLYARFKDRLRSMMTGEGSDKLTMLVVVIVTGAMSLMAPNARGANLSGFEQVCELDGVLAPGDYAIEVSQSLFGMARQGAHLSDVRIIGPDSREVPFTLRRASVLYNRAETSRKGTLLNPVELSDGATSVTVDFGEPTFRHDSVQLDIPGRNYMRHTIIESSVDGVQFGLLSKGQLVYSVFEENQRYARTRLRYPETNARYLRVTFSPGEDSQKLHVNGADAIIAEATSRETPLYRQVPLLISPLRRDDDGRTIVMLGKSLPNVPFSGIVFQVADGEFVRRVSIQASTHKESWFNIGGGIIYRINNAAGDDTHAEYLETEMKPTAHTFIRAVFHDGDDAPLTLMSAEAKYPIDKILFRTAKTGEHSLYVGNINAKMPQYDLDSIIRRSDRIEFAPVTIKKCHKNHLMPAAEEQTHIPWTEQYSLLLKILMGIVLLGLVVWTIRTLKNAGKQP